MTNSLAHAKQDQPVGPTQACPIKNQWIEIILQDDSGEPLGGEDYLLVAPGGAEIRGQLGADGFARVDGLDPGTCEVSFPNAYKRLKPVRHGSQP